MHVAAIDGSMSHGTIARRMRRRKRRRARGLQPHPAMKRATTALGIVVLLAGVAALALAFFDWNWLKGPLERQVAARTGRELAIAGDNPLLALAAFIETGPGRDSDCARLVAEAKSGWRASPPGNGR